jgi:putative tryptophan/tyrosine transport system substrate-binding protein
MKRREFTVGLLSAAITAAPGLCAQQGVKPVVGFLNVFSPPPNLGDLGPVHQGLNETGFVESQNMMSEYRWAEGHYDRLPALAADLVSRKVDVIVTIGGTPSALAAKNATSDDPGRLRRCRRPGRDRSRRQPRPAGRQPDGLQQHGQRAHAQAARAALRARAPGRRNRLAGQPEQCDCREGHQKHAGGGAREGVRLAVLTAGTEGEIDAAFASLVQLQAGGLVVGTDGVFAERGAQLRALASRHALPAIYLHDEYVKAGGLISYGIDTLALWRQAGIYAGRILKGERPADLPVQQPTRFRLVINLKTAMALGLTIPPSILARADEVIE